MSQVKDLLLDEDYDLAIGNGDLVIGEGDDQATALLLLTNQGEWKQSPLVGVGLRRYQSGPMDVTRRQALQRLITVQMEKDGFTVRTLTISPEAALSIDAIRK